MATLELRILVISNFLSVSKNDRDQTSLRRIPVYAKIPAKLRLIVGYSRSSTTDILTTSTVYYYKYKYYKCLLAIQVSRDSEEKAVTHWDRKLNRKIISRSSSKEETKH
jgi:hypothetical protein